jgi:hypothetical protein
LVFVAKYEKSCNLSLFTQIYVGIEKRSVHYEEAMYIEQNVTMYSDSKKKRKEETKHCTITCEKH